MALITKTEIKARLGITATTEDAYFDNLGIQVQELAEQYCRRRFEVVTRTDKVFDGRGGTSMDWFFVDDVDYPLISVTNLALNDDPLTPSVYTPITNSPIADALYVYPSSIQVNTSVNGTLSTWDVGNKNFKITYTCGGGLTVPELVTVKEALIDWAILMYRQKTTGGQTFKEERLLNYHYKLTASLEGDAKNLGPFGGLPQSVLSTLDLYKRSFNRLV